MPSVRSLAFKRRIYIGIVILLLGIIILIYSYCVKKKLVYIAIVSLSNYQPFFCSEYIKLNMRFSCNIKSILNMEYIFLVHLKIL